MRAKKITKQDLQEAYLKGRESLTLTTQRDIYFQKLIASCPIPFDQLLSESKHRVLADMRAILCYHLLSKFRIGEIALMFNKRHSTVSLGIKKYRTLIQYDKEFIKKDNELINTFNL